MIMASTTLESSSSSWTYDVFLSFRGTDTRKNFTDHLYRALIDAGIETYRDNENLQSGEEISSGLMKAIEDSRISIIVFSRNYASSRWCLQELAKIMECRKTRGQKVFPIFLDGASPSDVRNQKRDFETAFCRHEQRFDWGMVQSWRDALKEAADLSGWDEVVFGHQSNLVQSVVQTVLTNLPKASLDVTECLVGIESRVEKMMMLLNVESNCVQFVGICGMGGIGKTTIATVLYNQISSGFEGYSFLADVAEKSSEPNGLVQLQNELLDEILRTGHEKIYNVSQGKMVIKKRLHAKKVLLILDNVNKKQQLDALAGSNWFGPGSKIIVTTRDKQVLEIFQIGNVYRLEEMDADESLQLFSKHAFGRDRPPKGCMELSKNVINIAGGLPLALEVLGRTLSIEPPKDWESMVKKWEKFPHEEVEETLKISYDCLDDEVKRMFLDIACFFFGMDKKIVIDIWDSCGFSSGPGLKVLVRKSLVKIDDNNELRMHDQLRDMGRNIVCQENMEPRKRSRLWIHEEVLDVLKNPMGTLNVEALLLKYENKGSSSEVNLNTKAFASMPKLRLLQLDCEHFEGCLEHLPKKLNWLCWKRCPFESIPTDFHLEKLAVLDLSQSKIKKIWCPNKQFENLKVLNLSHCSYLTRSPEFSGLLCLERLILEGCVELIQIDETIEYLHKLVLLNLRCCSKLNKLPENLFGLESLEELVLDCTSIEQLPTSVGDLNNLTRLSLRGCRLLGRIPDSVWRINSLIFLTLGAIPINEIPDTDVSLNKLEKLHIESCGFFNQVPDWIGNVRNLRGLCINGSNITELPDVVGSLEKLERLDVSNCKQLVKLPSSMGKLRLLSHFNMEETGIVKLPNDFGLLSSLEELEMAFCREFEGFPVSFGSLAKLRILHAQYCSMLTVLPRTFSRLSSLKELNASCCNLIEGAIPEDFGELSKLETLELSRNPFATLPDSISGLSRLKRLHLESCSRLEFIPKLPSSLIEINANECRSMQRLPNLSNLSNLQELHLSYCRRLIAIDGLEGLESLRGLYMSGCYLYVSGCVYMKRNLLQVKRLQGVLEHLSYFTFPGMEIPEWFTCQTQTCEVSRHLAGEITGVILCIVLSLTKELPAGRYPFDASNNTIYIDISVWRNGRVISRSQTSMDAFTCPHQDQIFLCHFRDENEDFVSSLKGGDVIEVSKIFIPKFDGLQMKKCGIHMVYKPNERLESHNQDTQPSIYQKLADFTLQKESFFSE